MKMKHLCISHIFDAWDLISLEETGSLTEFRAMPAASNLPVSTLDSTGVTSLHVTMPGRLSRTLGCGNGIISLIIKVHFNFWVNINILRDFFLRYYEHVFPSYIEMKTICIMFVKGNNNWFSVFSEMHVLARVLNIPTVLGYRNQVTGEISNPHVITSHWLTIDLWDTVLTTDLIDCFPSFAFSFLEDLPPSLFWTSVLGLCGPTSFTFWALNSGQCCWLLIFKPLSAFLSLLARKRVNSSSNPSSTLPVKLLCCSSGYEASTHKGVGQFTMLPGGPLLQAFCTCTPS